MDPIQYLKGLRRRWLVIVATAGLGVVAAWLTTSVGPVASSTTGSGYQATSTILQLTNNSQSSQAVSITTAASLVGIPDVADAVAKQIGFTGPSAELGSKVSGTADEKTGLLKVTATAGTPKRAVELADAFAGQLINFLDQQQKQIVEAQVKPIQDQMKGLKKEIDALQKQVAGLSRTAGQFLQTQLNTKLSTYSSLASQAERLQSTENAGSGLLVVQKATPEKAQSTGFQAPRSAKSRMILGGLVGLLIGIGLALVLERLDNRIRTRRDAEGHFALPVLAEIPFFPRRSRKELSVSSPRRSRSVNAFRLLAAGVVRNGRAGSSSNDGHKDPQMILVTSSGPREGASTVVANLAATYAEQGRDVLVLSCDFSHPRIHRLLGVPGESGLSEALALTNGHPTLANYVRESKLVRGVRVVPSRSDLERSGELLASDAMKQALTEARGDADLILLDTAPLLAASEAASLLGEVDAVLVVARAGKTTTQVADRLGELLKRLGAPTAGVALNGSTDNTLPPPRWYRKVLDRREKPSEREKGMNGHTTGPAIPAKSMAGTSASRSAAIRVKASRAGVDSSPAVITLPEADGPPQPAQPETTEAERAAIERAAAERSAAERAATEQAATEQAATEQAATDPVDSSEPAATVEPVGATPDSGAPPSKVEGPIVGAANRSAESELFEGQIAWRPIAENPSQAQSPSLELGTNGPTRAPAEPAPQEAYWVTHQEGTPEPARPDLGSLAPGAPRATDSRQGQPVADGPPIPQPDRARMGEGEWGMPGTGDW